MGGFPVSRRWWLAIGRGPPHSAQIVLGSTWRSGLPIAVDLPDMTVVGPTVRLFMAHSIHGYPLSFLGAILTVNVVPSTFVLAAPPLGARCR